MIDIPAFLIRRVVGLTDIRQPLFIVQQVGALLNMLWREF